MILTVYMDDSSIHKGARNTVMGGYVGYSGAWLKFEKKWGRMLKKYNIPYFHAIEIYQRTGIFKGRSEEEKNQLFKKSEKISHAHSICGFVVVLSNELYEQNYKIVGKRPKGTAIPDSKYGMCFRMAMSALIHLTQWKLIRKRGPHKLNVVLEAGHQNSGDAERIFHLMKSDKSLETVRQLLGVISFGEKEECYGVQSADGLAYTGHAIEEEQPNPELARHVPDETIWDQAAPIAERHRRESGRRAVPIYRLAFNNEQLKELQTHLFVKNPLPTFVLKPSEDDDKEKE